MVDEIAIAVKSCFAGLKLTGFDFIRGLVLGFHLNEVKISSLPRNDFIKPTEKEITFSATNRFVISFCLFRGSPKRSMSFGGSRDRGSPKSRRLLGVREIVAIQFMERSEKSWCRASIHSGGRPRGQYSVKSLYSCLPLTRRPLWVCLVLRWVLQSKSRKERYGPLWSKGDSTIRGKSHGDKRVAPC